MSTVTQPEPAHGMEAKRDTEVLLIVGVGRRMGQRNDLKGMDLDQVQTALPKAELKLRPVSNTIKETSPRRRGRTSGRTSAPASRRCRSHAGGGRRLPRPR